MTTPHGTVTAVLSRTPGGDRIAVRWDDSIEGLLWARPDDHVVVGDRVEATREGTPTPLMTARQRYARAVRAQLGALVTAPLRQLEALDAELDEAARQLRAVGGTP
jgi:hypothetical protein